MSNFSVEFWFKGNNTTNATLLSNGRGDDQDLNKNGWSVRAGSSGLLEVGTITNSLQPRQLTFLTTNGIILL